MNWLRVDRRLIWYGLRRALGGRALDVYLHLLNYAWRRSRREFGRHNTDEHLIAFSFGKHISYSEMTAALGTGRHQLRWALDRLEAVGWIVRLTPERALQPAYLLGARRSKKEEPLLSERSLDRIARALDAESKRRGLSSSLKMPVRERQALAAGVLDGGAAANQVGSTEVVLGGTSSGGGAGKHQLVSSVVPQGTTVGATSAPVLDAAGAPSTPVAAPGATESGTVPTGWHGGLEEKIQVSSTTTGREKSLSRTAENGERDSSPTRTERSERNPEEKMEEKKENVDSSNLSPSSAAPPLQVERLEQVWADLHRQKYGEGRLPWSRADVARASKMIERLGTENAERYVRYIFSEWETPKTGIVAKWKNAQSLLSPTIAFAWGHVDYLYVAALSGKPALLVAKEKVREAESALELWASEHPHETDFPSELRHAIQKAREDLRLRS